MPTPEQEQQLDRLETKLDLVLTFLQRLEPMVVMAESMASGGPTVSTGKVNLPPGVKF